MYTLILSDCLPQVPAVTVIIFGIVIPLTLAFFVNRKMNRWSAADHVKDQASYQAVQIAQYRQEYSTAYLTPIFVGLVAFPVFQLISLFIPNGTGAFYTLIMTQMVLLIPFILRYNRKLRKWDGEAQQMKRELEEESK